MTVKKSYKRYNSTYINFRDLLSSMLHSRLHDDTRLLIYIYKKTVIIYIGAFWVRHGDFGIICRIEISKFGLRAGNLTDFFICTFKISSRDRIFAITSIAFSQLLRSYFRNGLAFVSGSLFQRFARSTLVKLCTSI